MAVQNVRVNILVDDAELKAAKKDVKAIAKELGVAEDQVEGVAQAMAESRAETKRFDESVKKMSKSLGISEKEARKLARETEKAKRESEKLAAGGKKVEKSFGGIGKAAKAAGVAILAAVSLRGIVNLAESAVNLAAAMEQNRVAFKTFLGSAKAADKLLGQIEKKAASTPFQFPELVESSKKLLAFNVEADKIIPTLSSIGDIAAGTGNSVSELAELYGKAKVQGRLFAEDVNQLTGRGIPIIQEFAKQFGVADSEVKKLVETGQIGFPALEKAFQNLTSEGGKFFGLTAAQSQTTAGLISTLRDNVERLVRSFGEKLLPVVNSVVEGLLRLIGASKDEVDVLEDQRKALALALPAVQRLKVGTKERADAVRELDEIYPGFLKNLDAETVGNSELAKRLSDVNNEIVKRIVLARKQQEINEAAELAADKLISKQDAQDALQRKLNALAAENNEVLLESNNLGEVTRDLQAKLLVQREAITGSDSRAKFARIELKDASLGLTASLIDLENARKRNRLEQEKVSTLEQAFTDLQKELFGDMENTFAATEKVTGSLFGLKAAFEGVKKPLTPTGDKESLPGSIAFLRKQVSELQKELDEKFVPGTAAYEEQLERLAGANLNLEKAVKVAKKAAEKGIDTKFIESNTELFKTLKKEGVTLGDDTKEGIEAFYENFKLPEDVEKDLEDNATRIGKNLGDKLAEAAAKQLKQDRIKDAIFSSIQSINDALFDLQAAQLERETEAQLEAIEIRRQRELQIADETGKGKEAINERFDKITESIEKKAAQRRKEIALAEALINTALGVTRALASLDPPFSFIQAATVGILGGIQIAKIQSTTFAKGGFTGKKRMGRDHTGQHIAGTVHDDEFVFNRGITKQHRQEFERVHRGESPYAVFGGAMRADLNDRRIVRHLGKIGGKIDQQTQYLKNLHGDTRGRFFHSRSSGRI